MRDFHVMSLASQVLARLLQRLSRGKSVQLTLDPRQSLKLELSTVAEPGIWSRCLDLRLQNLNGPEMLLDVGASARPCPSVAAEADLSPRIAELVV